MKRKTTSIRTQLRQGDILLDPIDELPRGLKRKNKILAYGEATGHHHRFDEDDENVIVLTDKDGTQYVEVVGEDAELKHEEHANINVGKGKYRLRQQREHDLVSKQERNVVD